MREWLEWRGVDFVGVRRRARRRRARAHAGSLAGGQRLVPVLVEDGAVVQVGWQGRGCVVSEALTW